jgi:hypothetical protein
VTLADLVPPRPVALQPRAAQAMAANPALEGALTPS